MPLITELERLGHEEDCFETEASLGYIVSFRPTQSRQQAETLS